MATMHVVLAHQGGWDELVYFAVPVVLAILAVRWAERRASRRRIERENKPGDNDETNRR